MSGQGFVLAGLLVPAAVIVNAFRLRGAAIDARAAEEEAFAKEHGLTMADGVMQHDGLSIALADDETVVTVAGGGARFWMQPDLVSKDKAKTKGLVKKDPGDEPFAKEVVVYAKADEDLPKALSSSELRDRILALRPLERGMRVERTAEETIVRVQERVDDFGVLGALVDVAQLIADDTITRKPAAITSKPTLAWRARVWMTVARVATVLSFIVCIPGAALPPIRTLGDMVSCGPGETVGSMSTGTPRMMSGMHKGGTSTFVCMTPDFEVKSEPGYWMFVVSFEIYFVLVSAIVAGFMASRRKV